MPQTELKLIKRCAEFQHRDDIQKVPPGRRVSMRFLSDDHGGLGGVVSTAARPRRAAPFSRWHVASEGGIIPFHDRELTPLPLRVGSADRNGWRTCLAINSS